MGLAVPSRVSLLISILEILFTHLYMHRAAVVGLCTIYIRRPRAEPEVQLLYLVSISENRKKGSELFTRGRLIRRSRCALIFL